MRLKSEIWVKAYLRRCAGHGAMAVIVRHGDDDGGAIFIKVLRGDGMAAVFAPAPAGLDDADFDRRWVPVLKGAFVAEGEADQYLSRQAEFDGDLWIIEVEDREGRTFFADELAP
jgi:hypothetical protein